MKMFSKSICRLLQGANLCRNNVYRAMSTPSIEQPHMNHAPVPHEPFETGYKRRQVGNNGVLLFGILFFTGSVTFVWKSGVIVPNLTPPLKNLGEK